jgi:hypothetical protein
MIYGNGTLAANAINHFGDDTCFFWILGIHPGQNNLETQMLIGLAHDRIIYLGMVYIERGYITQDEYENLYEYLYKPYKKLGGNGSAKRIMTEVDQLAIHKSTYNA